LKTADKRNAFKHMLKEFSYPLIEKSNLFLILFFIIYQ